MTTATRTDYSKIVPDRLILTRTPMDTIFAPRLWEEAYIEIDKDGTVSLRTRTRYGRRDGTPEDVWHGRRLVFTLASSEGGACALDVDQLREDLSPGGELAVLIDTVRRGHSIVFDGNNYVGRLTDEAKDATYELNSLYDYTSDASVWDAEEWLIVGDSDADVLDDLGLTINATEEEITEAARTLEGSAAVHGVILVGDMVEAIRAVIGRVCLDKGTD